MKDLIKKKIDHFKEFLDLLIYNFKILKYHIKEPFPGTHWYFFKRSRLYFRIQAVIWIILVIIVFFIFNTCRLIKKYESLLVFIYIIWFFSSLFYIEFIRIGA
jgi:hypothetical protein